MILSLAIFSLIFVSNAMAVEWTYEVIGVAPVSTDPTLKDAKNIFSEIKVTYLTNDGRMVEVTYQPTFVDEHNEAEIKDLKKSNDK